MYISNDESDGGGITLPPTTRLGTNANLFSNALPSTGVVSGQTAYTNISGNGFQSTFPSSREASLQPSHSSRAGGELSYQSNSAPGGGSSHAPEALIAHYRYNELPIDGMISTPSSHLSTTSINPQGNPQFPSIQNWPPPIPSAAPQPMNCNGTLQSNHALFSSDYLSNTGSAVNSLQPCSNPQDMLHSRPQAVETSLLYGYNHLDNIGVFRGRGGDDDMSDADIVDNQAESGPGELPRGVFSPSRSGVIAVDRPIPADRPESKRVTIAFPPHQAVPSNLDDINAIRARIRGSPGYQSFGLLYTQYVNDADTLPHTSASGSSSVAGLHTSRLLAVQTPENNRTSQNNVTLAALENRRASSTTTLDGPQMGRRQGQDNGIRQTQAPQEEFNFGDSNQELPWRFQDLRLD